MGEVISELARRALTAPAHSGFAEPYATFDVGAWPTFPGRDGVIVSHELVERIQDEIDREDSEPKDVSVGDRAG